MSATSVRQLGDAGALVLDVGWCLLLRAAAHVPQHQDERDDAEREVEQEEHEQADDDLGRSHRGRGFGRSPGLFGGGSAYGAGILVR